MNKDLSTIRDSADIEWHNALKELLAKRPEVEQWPELLRFVNAVKAKAEQSHDGDPWLRAMVRKWDANPPTKDAEGDDEYTRQARAELRKVMAACGWDIYGGSSQDFVVAMNYAWEEGFIKCHVRSAKAKRAPKEGERALTVEQIKSIVSEVEDLHPYKQRGNPDSYSSYNEGWSGACDILEQRLIDKLGDGK